MTSVEQFLFVLLPLVVLAGAVAAPLLGRSRMRDRRGQRGMGPHPFRAGGMTGR